MNFINWLKSLFAKKQTINYGIVDSDITNKAPSASVHLQQEVVAKIGIPTFKGINGDNTVRRFPYQWQDGSSGCVTFTTAKIGMVLYFMLKGVVVKFSPGFFYTQRSNKPEQGTIFDDLVTMAATKGCLIGE